MTNHVIKYQLGKNCIDSNGGKKRNSEVWVLLSTLFNTPVNKYENRVLQVYSEAPVVQLDLN